MAAVQKTKRGNEQPNKQSKVRAQRDRARAEGTLANQRQSMLDGESGMRDVSTLDRLEYRSSMMAAGRRCAPQSSDGSELDGSDGSQLDRQEVSHGSSQAPLSLCCLKLPLWMRVPRCTSSGEGVPAGCPGKWCVGGSAHSCTRHFGSPSALLYTRAAGRGDHGHRQGLHLREAEPRLVRSLLRRCFIVAAFTRKTVLTVAFPRRRSMMDMMGDAMNSLPTASKRFRNLARRTIRLWRKATRVSQVERKALSERQVP